MAFEIYLLGLATIPVVAVIVIAAGAAFVPNSRSWGCMICDAESEGQAPIWSWAKRQWHRRVTAKCEWHVKAYADRFPAHVQHPVPRTKR